MEIGPLGGGAPGSLDPGDTGAPGGGHPAPPREPTPAEIGDFADQARGHGLSPDDITRLMPTVAPLRRLLLERGTDLADLVAHQMQSEPEILQSIRATAHPTYPHLTAGEMMDTFRHASLHSSVISGRFPTVSEAANFASAKLNPAQIQDYYTRLSTASSTPRAEALGQRQEDRGG
jgi:hypothetical protein